MTAKDAHAALVDAVSDLVKKSGEKYIVETESAASLLLCWCAHLRESHSKNVCDELIDGVVGSVQEVAVSLSLGLVRSAIFSLRSQIELMLAWIYYNDHAVEWASVQRHPSKFQMRSTFITYFKNNSDKFEKRLVQLDTQAGRGKDEDLYAILSTHVHSTSIAATPKIEPLQNLIRSSDKCDQCVEMQRAVSEYLSDVMISWNAQHWHDLPHAIKSNIQNRFDSAGLKSLLT
jgi:hypothetical protein